MSGINKSILAASMFSLGNMDGLYNPNQGFGGYSLTTGNAGTKAGSSKRRAKQKAARKQRKLNRKKK